jgi:hypothetical protein
MLLRVDGSIVRVREVRFFHRFEKDAVLGLSKSSSAGENAHTEGCQARIHVAVTWRELNLLPDIEASVAGGSAKPASLSGPAAVPPNSSGWGILRPQELRNPQWIAERVPEVNRREDVLQYFTLYLG